MYGPANPGAAPVNPNVANQPEAALLENPAVRMWAHDVSVERGKTYRYRMTVVLSNPMFGQGNVMVPEQQAWSEVPVVRSTPSEWSEPIRVDDETYFFITSANAPDRLNRTSGAHAELFVFKWGRWRKGDSQLEPGDRLRADVKYPDISTVLAMLPMDPADGAQPPIPGMADPAGGGGGGGKGRAPGAPPAPSPTPNPSQIDRRNPDGRLPAPPPPPGGNRLPQPPDGGDPAKRGPLPMVTEPVAVDAIFLSVAAAQSMQTDARSRSGMVAYLRDSGGQVVPRYPDAERASVLLARLDRSAEQGMKDLQPNVPVVPDPVRRPDRDADRPPPPPPGGGGGGSGGG